MIVVSESPFVQPHLYDAQTPPVVYLSGTLLFIAGLAILRAHHHWARDWTLLITLSGWFALALGVLRMFAAEGYQRQAAQTGSSVFIAVEAVLLVCGLILTFHGYRRGGDA